MPAPAPDHPPRGAAPPRPPPPKPNQKLLSLFLKAIIMTVITSLFFLFLGVAAILLLLATAALHRHTSSPSSNSSDGFCLQDLKKLQRFRFSTKTKPQEPEITCAVCLEGIRQGQWCRNLIGCGHVFHRKCVDAWLVKVPACPICRTRVRLDHTVEAEKPPWGFHWRNDLRVW